MIDSNTLELPNNPESIMVAKRPALAYLRTSSKTNVGEDKDSHKRQLAAIQSYAKRAGYVIELPPYVDAAVCGSDLIEARTGFAAMLSYLADHSDVKTILVETSGRFSRDIIVQETGHRLLKQRGIDLIAVDSPDQFMADGPTADLVRTILGAVSQFERAMLVSKLRGARMRKRAATGKCEGRKSHVEAHPETVKLAKSLRWINKRMRKKRSLRDIAAELAKTGHLSASGNPYVPSAIQSMLTG
jgi:DNA invertase Pin-like site-specific DNA recombinase